MQRDARFDSDGDASVVRVPWTDEHAPHHIVIPDAHLLFTAHFKKAGPDLVLVGEDGKKVLVTDYFRSSSLRDLQSPEGAVLTGDLVARLAVPDQPAQYAQAGAPAGAKVIGRVEKVTGTATVQHANGLVVELKVGDLLVQGDVVQTSDGSSLGIGMVDGTAFNMDASARMVLTEMVYDPNGSSNSSLFNIVQGSITYVAGKVAKTGDMKVATPVATMGIRGTTVISKYNVNDGTAEISLLSDQDGSKGVIAVLDNGNLANVLATITDTDVKLIIRPVGAGQVAAQVSPLSPAELSVNAGFAQLVYQISNAISANPLTIDLQPRSAPSRGSGDNPAPQPNNDIDHTINPGTPPNDLLGKITFTGGVDPLTIGSSYLVLAETAQTLSVFTVAPPIVTEAGVLGPGNPTSTVPIVLSDVDATPSFDITTMLANGWVGNSDGTLSNTGTYGTATLDPATGNITYVLDNTKADDLSQNEHVTDPFTVLVKDNNGNSVTLPVAFAIDGANDAPKVSAPVVSEKSEKAAAYTLDLLTNASDVDHGAVLHVENLDGELPAGITLDADGHTLHVDPSVYASLAEDQKTVLHFTYNVVDEHGASVAQTATITIDGVNDAPTVSAPVSSETSQNGSAYTLDLLTNASDVDQGAILHVENFTDELPAGVTLDEDSHTLHVDPSVYASLAQDQKAVFNLSYDVVDEHGASVAQTATITIDGVNDAPTVSAPVSAETSQNAAAYTLDLLANASDVDQGTVLHIANLTDELPAGVTLDDDGHTLHVDPNAYASLPDGHQASFDFTYDVVDEHGGSVTQTATVTIDGLNDAATIDGVSTGAVVEGGEGPDSASGTLNVHDVDSGEAAFQAVPSNALAGDFGTFTFNETTGAWTYAIDPDKAASLTGGTVVDDTLTVKSIDGTAEAVIDVTITGTNETAVLSADTRDLTETNSAEDISASGQLTVQDVDAGEDHFQAQDGTEGQYGTFSILSDGTWTYLASSAHDEFVGGVTYIDTFDVFSADGTHTSVTINILGTNDTAVVSADTRNLAETNSAEDISTSGQLTISDPDAGEAHFLTQNDTAGLYGTFSIAPNGVWSYVANSAHNEFVGGQTYTDVFDVVSADGTHTSVTVYILGTNDTAVLSADGRNLTETNSATDISTFGQLAVSDLDAGEAHFQTQNNTAGQYGKFSIGQDGAWTYTANSAHNEFIGGQTYTDVFDVQSADGTHTSVTIHILGTNDTAGLTADVRNLTETNSAADISTSGQLMISDADAGEAHFLTQNDTAGLYGKFSIAPNGVWSYVASSAHNEFVGGQTYTDVFDVVSADGTQTSVTINILGTNDTAVLTADVRNLTETNSAADISTSGQLAISDLDAGEAHFQTQNNTAGQYGKFSIGQDGSWTYTANSAHNEFVGGQTYTDVFDVVSADGTHTSVTINILGTNDTAGLTADVRNLTETNSAADISTSGQLMISDADAGEAHFLTQNDTAGQYGKFSIGQDGAWTYTANSAHNEFIGGQTYTDVFDVVSADGTHTSVTIHILGTNDTAVLSADVRNLTETNSAADISTFGQLTVSDLDAGEAHFQTQNNTAGQYGKFSIGQDGSWTYSANSAHNEFIGGQTYTDVFDVVSADGTHTSVTIHILGTNDTAVLSADVRNLTETNSAADISTFGQLAISDLDAGEAHFQTQNNTAGQYGKFSIGQDGSWTYSANSAHNEFIGGQTYTDVFDVVSADGTHTSVTIHILGTNDSAIISGTASGTVVEAGGVGNATPGTPTATGTLTAADVDNTPNLFQAAAGFGSKGYGSYSITSAGVWLYTLNNAIAAVQGLNNGQQLTDTFTVQTVDGTAQVVTITIDGRNDAAVIAGTSSGTVVEAGGVNNGTLGTPTASGTLTDADVDNPANTFQAASGSGANSYGSYTVTAAGAWVYTLDNGNTQVQGLNVGQHLTDTFTVLTADGTAQVVTVTINGANDAPVAVADSFSASEDHALTVVAAAGALANDTDVDTAHASLKAILDSGPAHGKLVFNQDGSFTYTPELNFSGTDTFTYHANDGSLSSAPVIVSVDVGAVNDKPIVLAPSEIDYWTVSASGNVSPINHISFLDADAGSDSVTVTLSFASGNASVLTAADVANDGVGVAGSGTNAVTLTGSIADINAYLAGNHVLFNPAGNAFPIGDQTLNVSIDDNGHNGAGGDQTASAQILLHSFNNSGNSGLNFGNGDDFLDLHDVNVNGVVNGTLNIHMGSGNNTIVTSWNNLNVVNYDADDTGGGDTGTLVFSPDQLVQILSDTSAGGFESKLQTYLDGDPGTAQFADTLNLSASSWKAIISGLETAWVALASNDDYVVYSAIGDNLPDLRSNQTGTSSDDTLVATAAHANLSGGNGNDILVGTSVGSQLDGGAGSDLLLGSTGSDKLTGGGGDDIMWGGQGSDTFKFAPNFGQDTVLDFHSGEDVIELDHTIFADFIDLIAHTTDHGHDVIINAGSGNTITLKDMTTSVLHASDFHFV